MESLIVGTFIALLIVGLAPPLLFIMFCTSRRNKFPFKSGYDRI